MTEYLSKHRLAEIAASLNGRDRDILATLKACRIATAVQLERLHFHELAVSGRDRQRRSVLARLTGLGLLEKSDRRVGGARAGSAGFVYWLSSAGWRLVEPENPARRRRGEVGRAFRDHALAISELLVASSEADRAGLLGLQHFEAEPASWRGFGSRRTLKPDAYIQIQHGQHSDHWFIEVDRSTESSTVLRNKCLAYLDALHAGLDGMGELFPAVLWQVPDMARAEAMLRIIESLPEPASQLFYISTPETTIDALVTGPASP